MGSEKKLIEDLKDFYVFTCHAEMLSMFSLHKLFFALFTLPLTTTVSILKFFYNYNWKTNKLFGNNIPDFENSTDINVLYSVDIIVFYFWQNSVRKATYSNDIFPSVL